jgi:hypothetical protein
MNLSCPERNLLSRHRVAARIYLKSLLTVARGKYGVGVAGAELFAVARGRRKIFLARKAFFESVHAAAEGAAQLRKTTGSEKEYHHPENDHMAKA